MGRSVCRNSNSAVDNLVCPNSRAKSSPVRSATTCDVREGLRPSSVARSSSPIYSVFRRRKKVVICSRRVAPAGVAVSCQLAKRAARQRSASSRSDKFSGGAGKAPGSTVDERRARRSTIPHIVPRPGKQQPTELAFFQSKELPIQPIQHGRP